MDKRTVKGKKKEREQTLIWGSIVSLWDMIESISNIAKEPMDHINTQEQYNRQQQAISALLQANLPLSYLLELYAKEAT